MDDVVVDGAAPGEGAGAEKREVIAPVAAGFWLRVFAFLVDGVVLGLIGSGIGLFFFDSLVRMAGWERLIGLALTLAYFVPFNSRLGGGQSPGKRLLGLRVVGKDGNTLSVLRTVGRQLILAAPFFLNNAPFGTGVYENTLLLAAISVIVFGGLISMFYLLVFNRNGRQLVHDLVVGSYVVQTSVSPAAEGPVAAAPLWRGHLWIIGAIVALAMAAPIAALYYVGESQFRGLLKVQERLAKEPDVLNAGVNDGWTQRVGGPRTTHLDVTVQVAHSHDNDDEYSRRIARIALETYPQAAKRDRLTVTTTRGYNMVIWSSKQWSTQAYDPADIGAVDGR